MEETPRLIPGSGRYPGEGLGYPLQYSWVSLVAQLVKNPPVMQETWVQSLGWEDALEKGKATHSSILENSMDRGSWQGTVHGVAKSQTQLRDLHTHHFHFYTWNHERSQRKGWTHLTSENMYNFVYQTKYQNHTIWMGFWKNLSHYVTKLVLFHLQLFSASLTIARKKEKKKSTPLVHLI